MPSKAASAAVMLNSPAISATVGSVTRVAKAPEKTAGPNIASTRRILAFSAASLSSEAVMRGGASNRGGFSSSDEGGNGGGVLLAACLFNA